MFYIHVRKFILYFKSVNALMESLKGIVSTVKIFSKDPMIPDDMQSRTIIHNLPDL